MIMCVPEATSIYGFHVTKFVCSHAELYEGVEAEERADAVKEISMGTSMKALGILWSVDINALLSQVASLHDPLGLIAPVILHGKALFQEATNLSSSWRGILRFLRNC